MAELKLEDIFFGSNMGDYSSTDPELLDIFGLGNHGAPHVKEMAGNIFQRQVDQQLIQATMTVLRTGKLTPLIKEELKCTIQNRRLARGEEELAVDMSPPPTSHLRLSTEEEADVEQRRRSRREKNRISAQKSRQKRKAQGEGIAQQCKQLEMKNLALQTEYENLSREKAIILQALQHLRQQQQSITTTLYHSPI